ncbi:hypothetical protein NW758_004793 [Fusarium oxysporum]|nr:hypothetical protein NW758_004793 [Fusarium oxysporum]
MASFNYDTTSTSYWGKIVAIGLVWTPSAYFFNSWVNNQPPGAFVSIAWVIFSTVSLLACPQLFAFGFVLLLSPFFAIAALYWLILELPGLCAALGPWCLSLFWAQRSPLYASRLEMPQGRDCRLCGRCSIMVDRSSILRGTRWRLTRSKEEYDFHTKDQLLQSAENCHLCSLLWHSSFGAQIIPAPGVYPGETVAQEPDSTTPLLSEVASSRNPLHCERGDEAAKLSVQITATRRFGQEQLLNIRLYKKGSRPFPSLTIEDNRLGTSAVAVQRSQLTHRHNLP